MLGPIIAVALFAGTDLRCEGTGAPTVVMESGWGADGRAWDGVRARLEGVRTCAYGRPGSGGSPPVGGRRGPAEMAKGLRAALRAAGERGPFVLVGHSAGGVYVRAFAAAYPREVAGLVLVDSSALDQGTALGLPDDAAAFAGVVAKSRRCHGAALSGDTGERAKGCAVAGDATRAWGARLGEISALAAPTAAERVADRARVRVPVVVLSAGRQPPETARAWAGLHARMAAASPDGELRVVDSGHLMMRDAPGAVAQAVREMVAKARR